MEVFARDERYCGTCDHWRGPRLMSECGHVHALGKILGYCQMDSSRQDAFGFCDQWSRWMEAE